jgi:hypothetical protein
LLREDVEGDEELRHLQDVYRPYQRCGQSSPASFMAQRFEDRVRELAKGRAAQVPTYLLEFSRDRSQRHDADVDRAPQEPTPGK